MNTMTIDTSDVACVIQQIVDEQHIVQGKNRVATIRQLVDFLPYQRPIADEGALDETLDGVCETMCMCDEDDETHIRDTCAHLKMLLHSTFRGIYDKSVYATLA